ncbi:nitrate reductase molybdenum cofactor assembly chaperone [Halospina sp. K52047b]|uniref:nitrate reductase molybdenum cofactor assembly chaperone n=1 Tax=Halospina sp. K52047b TaxID=2614160 RepID=UPI0017880401|nr:nitrate reductase molybdenum cofactor assembly chaperone [Halospina sp. K52047b]
MMKTLRAIAHLMAYPTGPMQEALPELAEVIREESRLTGQARDGLLALIDDLAERPLGEIQENYVSLFDRGRHLSLHLFEHVHGESRDRGQAMVDLMEHYRLNGYELDAKELPDHIPLFLEYLSTQDETEITDMLGDAMPVMVLLGARLEEKESPYAALFHALEAIGGSCEQARDMRELAANEGPDESITRMDEIWEEEQVTFLGNNDPAGGGCGNTSPGPATTPTDEIPVRWVDNPGAQAAGQR